jgi:hypothetical protein
MIPPFHAPGWAVSCCPANFMSSASSSRTAATKRDLVGKLGTAVETA